MKKIKVCYVISSLSNQGPPNVLYNIVQYMDFDRFDVSIITMVKEQRISRIAEFKKFPINIVQMCPNGIQNPISMFFTLRKVVRRINPDILHTHCPRSMFLVPFLSSKYKKIATVHIYPGVQQKVMYGSFKGQIVIWLSHFCTRLMDMPIACSESVAQSYLDNHNFKMKAIPNGCSLPIWDRNEEEKIELRSRLGLKLNIKYFIFIGRFSKEKNPEMIIRAFQLLRNKYDDVGLILLGSGDLFDELIHFEDGSILLPGFKNNVYDYLKASDYYISASDVEGLANTLLESMTVGLPCVLSDIPSHREVLSKSSRVFGYLFDNKNINDLLEAMEKVLKVDAKMLSSHIQSLFLEYYTAKSMSVKYQNCYRQIVTDEN